MEFLTQYGLFLAKTVTFVVAILIIIAAIGGLIMRQKSAHENKIEVKKLNTHFENMAMAVKSVMLNKHDLKIEQKAEKKRLKLENKKSKNSEETKKRIYVLNFDGDIKASSVETLREEISAILTTATKDDEVVVKLESGGGMVHGYGLAASQLKRIRDKDIPLTVCVDKIAASGGYMMACVGNQIVSAPFAIIGSIGVLAQIPNFNKVLKNKDIDYEQFKAGEYKRTVTLFGETTDEDRQKMQSDIDETHALFKEFVSQQRPSLDIDKVATGEHWFGTQALELGLVDIIKTSDDYLMERSDNTDILELTYHTKKTLKDKFPLLQALFNTPGQLKTNETDLHLR